MIRLTLAGASLFGLIAQAAAQDYPVPAHPGYPPPQVYEEPRYVPARLVKIPPGHYKHWKAEKKAEKEERKAAKREAKERFAGWLKATCNLNVDVDPSTIAR